MVKNTKTDRTVIRDCQLRVPATALMAERAVADRLANALAEMIIALASSERSQDSLVLRIAAEKHRWDARIEAREALVEWRDSK